MEVRLDDKLVTMYKEQHGVDLVEVNVTEDSIVEISYKDKEGTMKKDYRDLEDIVNELLSI